MLAAVLTVLVIAGALPGCSGERQAGVENRGSDTQRWWDALPRAQWAQFERLPSEQDWFEVYRLRETIYAIYEPGQFEEVISFLIVGRRLALLFDTGLGMGDIHAIAIATRARLANTRRTARGARGAITGRGCYRHTIRSANSATRE